MTIRRDNSGRRLRAKLRRQWRILCFRYHLGRDYEGRRSLKALRRLAPAGVPFQPESFSSGQWSWWRRYLDESGRIVPLSITRLLVATLGWFLLLGLVLGLAGAVFLLNQAVFEYLQEPAIPGPRPAAMNQEPALPLPDDGKPNPQADLTVENEDP
ncbi:MAG: hypothetical protein GY856_19895 [bacterium]|nr:hypothetical protein [bacterium]